MGKTFSAHIKNDDLVERIEEAIESGEYHNQAHFFVEAVKKELPAESKEHT